ncbi:hypothetical protein OQA88_9563 [Cercophora sp. LCS_1]
METVPVTGLDELESHLTALISDPSTSLNPKLFDDVELQLTESNIPPLVIRFLPKLTTILKQYTSDPAVIVSLTIKLLSPVSFRNVLSLASEESLIQALDSPAPAANILALAIIHKAAANPADAAILSAMPALVSAFLRRWLAAPQVEVGQKGGKVLGDILDIDCALPPPPTSAQGTELVLRKAPGQGRMWARVFGDRATYGLVLDLCSGRHPDTEGNAHQLSLAQGRLLRVLLRLAALNFEAVTRSEFAAATPVHLTNGHGGETASGPRRGEGLLQFAALRMVDKGDVLMHLSLVDFFEAWVGLMRVTEYSARKVETVKAVVAEATAGDEVLKDALLSLPERTVEEEQDGLRRWLAEIMPGQTVRVAVR